MNRFPFALSKFLVYLRLWGFRQTLYKILGRSNLCLPLSLPAFKKIFWLLVVANLLSVLWLLGC